MSTNPYAPPKAELREPLPTEAAPALWNPNAAANWSLLFTPTFGALLQMRNWEALGQERKAVISKRWAIANLILLIVTPVITLSMKARSGAGPGWLVLIVWYVANGRQQATYVKERFAGDYPRRGWGAPLGFGVLALIGYGLLLLAFAAFAARS